jgi:hypothetical protein
MKSENAAGAARKKRGPRVANTPLFDALVREYDYPEHEFPFLYEYPEMPGLILINLRRADGTTRKAYRGGGVRL